MPASSALRTRRAELDRRPIDPPPIVQLVIPEDKEELRLPTKPLLLHVCVDRDARQLPGAQFRQWEPHNRWDGSSIAPSSQKHGGFFIFPDMSVRVEGKYRIKFSLFEITGGEVVQVSSVYSEIFTVYSPKLFPGMSESTFLTRSFSDQGVRIRIRKENRTLHTRRKRSEEADDDGTDEDSRSQSSNRTHSPNSADSLSPSPTSNLSFATNIRPTNSSTSSRSGAGSATAPGRFNQFVPYCEEYAYTQQSPPSSSPTGYPILDHTTFSGLTLSDQPPLPDNDFAAAPLFPPLPPTSASPRLPPSARLPPPSFIQSSSPRNPQERKQADGFFTTLFTTYAKQHRF
ncbi:velvet factor-domain-containing protein, partial [Jimgerdemannia flammicorona]